MQTLSSSQASAEVPINENFETLSHQAVYGKKQPTTSGLTWGYWGGRWGGFSVADGTLALTASNTNYVVVEIATGAITVSTSNTNWNDTTNYLHVYKLTTSASAVTATEDHRAGTGGVHGGSGGGGGGGAVSSVNGQTGAVSLDASDVGAAADGDITLSGLTQATGTLLGRSTASTGAVEEITVGSGLSLSAGVLSATGGGGAAAGRNLVINGNFAINQRAVSGSVVLAAGVYGHDRWKAGASGCSYTFSTSANVTTLTISAGSLIQVVEGLNLFSGTHVLSWTGTAQGKIGAGSYSASGVTGAATGGTNLNVEFNTGTLSLVQLETGSTATAFELRHIGKELRLCQRYFARLVGPGFMGHGSGTAINTTDAIVTLIYPVSMRATPTVTINSLYIWTSVNTYTANSLSASSYIGLDRAALRVVNTGASLTAGQALNLVNNGTTGYVQLDTEL